MQSLLNLTLTDSYLKWPYPEPVEEHERPVELLDVVGEHVHHLPRRTLAQRRLAQSQRLYGAENSFKT